MPDDHQLRQAIRCWRGRHRNRRRVRALLHELQVGPLYGPCDIREVCTRLARYRGRPIILHPAPLPASATGLLSACLPTAAEDHIFYLQHTSRYHQDCLIACEIARLIIDDDAPVPGEGLACLLPYLAAGTVHRIPIRDSSFLSREWEAEDIGIRILARAGKSDAYESEIEELTSLSRAVAAVMADQEGRKGPGEGKAAP